ncbi:MAG: hypothetical protein A2Y38_07775 [Spirochaetes bacterium GWB1_59_5]|nr:MAG: hypothetical protein A2Y38_07775 [Spirochaetes bacterium GWB1_59_5]
MRTVQKLTAPLARRVRLMVGRAVLTLVDDSLKLQGLQVRLLDGELRSDVERMQEYGFTSHPHPGAEAAVVFVGGSRDHGLVIAVDDRRYRLKALAAGEVAFYDDQGQAVHLKRDKTLHVYGSDHLMADVAIDAVVNCPLVTVNAAAQVTLNTPLVQCTGNLLVAGGITSSGTYGASGGKIQTPGDIESSGGEVKDQVRAMSADRALYNGHTHSDPQGGSVGAPTPQQ